MEVPFTDQLDRLAEADPERAAVTFKGRDMSRRQLQLASLELADLFRQAGVERGDFVSVAHPNGFEWVVGVVATWRVGAVPHLVSVSGSVESIRDVLALVNPRVVYGDAPPGFDTVNFVVSLDGYAELGLKPASRRNAVISPAWKAVSSGGSTGRPKVIKSGFPAAFDADAPVPWRLPIDDCVLVPGPLSHNGPAAFALKSLLYGNRVVIFYKFDAEEVMAAAENCEADTIYLVPTMMKRILRLDPHWLSSLDLSHLRQIWHMAEPCPEWLKRRWISWLGAEKVMELYSSTEAQQVLTISGDEWLAHPGSVGRPEPGLVEVRRSDGTVAPAGEVGEVWYRVDRDTPTYEYLGAEPSSGDESFETLGDLGRIDADGYLYLAGRTADLIITGGSNVYAQEVELALSSHPHVRSAIVIGLPDPDFGQRVHAIVSVEPQVTVEALEVYLRDRIQRYKVPKSWELTDDELVSDAGKVNRRELIADRAKSLHFGG